MNRFGRATETLMRMDDAVWQRHANPWSVWTRVAILPLVAVAVWSRIWIGWWFCVPTALLVVWVWVNPRFFAKPISLESWASRGVLGERIWLANAPGTIAEHHRHVIRMLVFIASAGGVVFIAGLIYLDVTATFFGLSLAMLGKLWFVDRMVWIQRENEQMNS